MKQKHMLLCLMILSHISLQCGLTKNDQNTLLRHEEDPSYESTTTESPKSFIERHSGKIIALSLAGSLALIPLLLWYRNQNQSPSTSHENPGPTEPSPAPKKQPAPSTEKQEDSQGILRKKPASEPLQATKPPVSQTGENQGDTEDARRAAQEQAERAKEEEARKQAEHLKKEKEIAVPAAAVSLEKIYYEPKAGTQKELFDKLWQTCKSNVAKRRELETNFYTTMAGAVSQSEIDKYYGLYNKDAGNKTLPITYQDAQAAYQTTYGVDALTPFDKYEIALELLKEKTMMSTSIYNVIKRRIEKNRNFKIACPELTKDQGNDFTLHALKEHPALLAVTSEVRAIGTSLSNREIYKSEDAFNVHTFGLSLRNNPDEPLTIEQLKTLSRISYPASQAKAIISKAVGRENSLACQQAVEWLTLAQQNKETVQLAFEMTDLFQKGLNEKSLNELLEKYREEETYDEGFAKKKRKLYTFKKTLFDKAFAIAQQILAAHSKEPAYTTWQDALKGLEQRLEAIKERDELKGLIFDCIPAPVASGHIITKHSIQQANASRNQNRIEELLKKHGKDKEREWLDIIGATWRKKWSKITPIHEQEEYQIHSNGRPNYGGAIENALEKVYGEEMWRQ